MADGLGVPPPGFGGLTVVAHEVEEPVPELHWDILDERLAELAARPEGGRSWEDIEAELLMLLPKR
jgi:hypothetical protein